MIYEVVFELSQKLDLHANFCKPIHDIITSFWIWKVWKWREKTQKAEYLENEKSFWNEIKNSFSQFLMGYHLVKK